MNEEQTPAPAPKKPTIDEQIAGLRQQREQLLSNVHAIEGAIKAFEMVKNGDITIGEVSDVGL